VEKPVFKAGKIPSNLLVFGGRGRENTGHLGYGAYAGRGKATRNPSIRCDVIRRKHYGLRTEEAYLSEI
jgi:hypothetical protein